MLAGIVGESGGSRGPGGDLAAVTPAIGVDAGALIGELFDVLAQHVEPTDEHVEEVRKRFRAWVVGAGAKAGAK